MRDAWVPIDLYKAYKDLPDLTVRMSPEAVRVSVAVDIMPSGVAQLLKRLPRQKSSEIEGKAIAFGIDLTKLRSLVKVVAVDDAQAIAYFPTSAATDQKAGRKCRCGRASCFPTAPSQILDALLYPSVYVVEACHWMRLCPEQPSNNDEDGD